LIESFKNKFNDEYQIITAPGPNEINDAKKINALTILDNGKGYIWHEINDCGDKLYDGSPVSNECPKRD